MRRMITGGIGIALAIFVILFMPSLGRSAETINMLAIDPISGPFKDVGDRYQLGVRFAVEEINAKGGLLGRQIKMFYDDSQLKPDVAARKVQRYVTQENVKFVMLGSGTHVAKGVNGVVAKENIIFLNYGASSDELTGADFIPNHFRVCLNTAQHSGALAAYFAGTPYKRYYILCQDYAAGHAQANAFKKAMDRFSPGWQLVGEGYHPTGTKDFGPYITQINASKAEVLITGSWGADLTNIVKQGASMGLKAKIGAHFMSDPVALSAMGDATVGAIAADCYLMTEDNPKNKAFIERWKARNMDPAHPYPANMIGKAYNAFMFMAEAIKKANSIEAQDVIKAWEGLSYDGIAGRMQMRACDHQVLTPASVGEIVPGPGRFYKFPYVGKSKEIPMDKTMVTGAETGNPRCK